MRYSCWTADPNNPRGQTTESWMQAGWTYQQRGDHMTREPVMKRIRTDWLPMACGVKAQAGVPADPGCDGCANDGGKPRE